MVNVKYIILTLLILAACTAIPTDNTDTSGECTTSDNLEYIEEYCPRCKGVGQVELSTGERILWGCVTFGGGFLFETMDCDMCNGIGVVRKRKIK